MSELSKRIERRLKRLVFGTLLSRNRGAVDAPTLDLSSIRRVLFVRANFRMGNLLLATPALAAVRRALPAARVDVLGTALHEVLLRHHPDVDGILCLSRGTLARPWSLLRLARRIRRARYDLVVDCARGGSFLGAVLCGLSGGRYRVAAASSRYRAAFNVLVPRPTGHRHKIDLLLGVLEDIGIPPVTRDMKVALTEEERRQATRQWAALGLPDAQAVVGVMVGGRGGKRLPMQHLVETVAGIRQRAHVALLVGPEEQELIGTLRQAMPEEVTIIPPLPLREFAALLARFALVVTADTGPMHLAVAVGVPTVALLRSEASLRYRPLGARHRVLYDEQVVAPNAVIAAVDAILRREADDTPPADASLLG